MTETAQTPHYSIGPDEKVVQVMAYTPTTLYWGEVVVKQIVRVSTWLRTNTAPDRVTMYNARAISVLGGAQVKPIHFSELHIATTQIQIFHMVPPAKDPVDYDATEPNRKMMPVSLLLGTFRVDGNLRMATQSTLTKFLEVAHETFTSVYDAQISNTMNPGFGNIQVPLMIVRQEATVFTMP